jgi:tRNA threonylcarbamoyladenosine biosynthesis protein TsaB
MAYAAKDEPVDLLCPMIDARRQEVFTALFDKKLSVILKPQAMILDETSFISFLKKNKILFFGNGSKKFQQLMHHPNALYKNIPGNASHLAFLSYENFKNKEFADLTYTEPLYLKEFQVKTQ